MTDEGRNSIRSAKPLEQYLAEKITSKKIILDQLNAMPVEEGYQKVLSSFTNLPAPFSRLSEIHHKLGWLHEDGISSEYGLMDVNDSGFISENEIDKTYCKELQAVVRRDHQLWYDADIVKHFDNAGKVLIQLHEEFYTWGKEQDEFNGRYGYTAHDTSTKTRRLILKILDDKIDHKLVNENLKSLGFSIQFWDKSFNLPTSAGYFMDTESCILEQQFLKNYLTERRHERDFALETSILFSNRYLNSSDARAPLELRHNFPTALANMIARTITGSSSNFATEIMQLQSIFERPESCQGKF
ncbi:MAG: hypothetical protein HUU57_08870 [Bdellovibrio sp.]|nr:hypothetical protein [Bdellovibrio sp.]